MNRKEKIYTETYMFLVNLKKELIDKIPEELKDKIISNADTNYPYKVDELLPESKELITLILEKYLVEK